MTIKSKLHFGISFLFLMALICSGLAAYYLNRLSFDSKAILKDNYQSLVYTKNLNQVLDSVKTGNATRSQLAIIEKNIAAEEKNITEPGEKELADSLRITFQSFKNRQYNPQTKQQLNFQLKQLTYAIMQLNMQAITGKDKKASQTANTGIVIVSLIGSFCFLICISFVVNFPGYVTKPIKVLTQAIQDIAGKNYNKRLVMPTKDEFGELATAFNQMAHKLNEYESSNLANLLFEKKRIETIINSMTDAIIGLDDRMNIVFANKVACTLMEVPEETLVGRNAPDTARQNDVLHNILFTDEHKIKLALDKRESYFTKDTLDVVNDEKSIGKVIILKNVTEYHQLNEAKTNFIATISHELKTPISSIKMSLKLLDDVRIGSVNTEQKQLLQNMDADTRRLLQITGELLDMAQVETGKIQLNFGSTHPQNIVSYAVQAIRFLAEQKEIAITVDCPETLPNVLADLDKTTWVLINLLSNAVKYSSSKSQIDLVVKKHHNHSIEFSVQDHGQGIEDKYLSRIFERYFKVPGAGPDKTGTGLGLAIAKDFIEAQGGHIGVDSEPGIGSRFYFSLKINA
jgi:signal transduction histidine kinase